MSGLQTERRRRARATALVSLMLLSLLSVTPAQATGEPANLQAQGITAAFNTTTEITTITWENSDTNDARRPLNFPPWLRVWPSSFFINSLQLRMLMPVVPGGGLKTMNRGREVSEVG